MPNPRRFLQGMARHKTDQGHRPHRRAYLDRSYAERRMDGASHHPAVGFMFFTGAVLK